MLFEKRVTIIKSEAPLLEQFMPENVLHREGQKQAVAACLRPVTLNRKPRNAFLYGPCGTGKTLLTKWLMQELEKHTSSTRTAYVNCWKRNTTHSALCEILNQLDVFTNYRQSVAELMKLLELQANKKQIIVALDEVDALDSHELLYDLTRTGIGLVAISNDAYALMDIDPRIKSSLGAEGIEMPAYGTNEITEILDQRRQWSLVPGSIKATLLSLIARLADGDARIALETLRRSALLAEDQEAEVINKEYITQAFQSTRHLRKTEALKKLNEHEKALYMLVEETQDIGTQELYNAYKASMDKPATQRSYRNYMNHLVRLGLVKAKGELTGRCFEFLI